MLKLAYLVDKFGHFCDVSLELVEGFISQQVLQRLPGALGYVEALPLDKVFAISSSVVPAFQNFLGDVKNRTVMSGLKLLNLEEFDIL
jgi:hypothetical protein